VELLRWALPRLRLHWPGFRRVRRQVRRRLMRRMRELGIRDAASYRARLEADPAEWRRLDAMCRISISRCCRDRGLFEALEERVLPSLAERARAGGRSELRAWSAGCASGEEPYSLAILWRYALATRHPDVRLSIVATDADPRLLERARRGCYRASSLREVPPLVRSEAFERRGGLHCIRRELAEGVELACQDLCEEQPAGLFDLVLCRNVAFTYFAPDLQREALARILAHLRRGGALAIGSHESLPDEAALAPWPGARGVYERAPG
jgi:chemotaxis protein methyltransferase CheR